MRFTLLALLVPFLAVLGLAAASPLAAQLRLSGPGLGVPQVGGVLGEVTDRVGDTLEAGERQLARQAQDLLRARERILSRLLRQNRDAIERDAQGHLARRGELLAMGLDEARLGALAGAGFFVISHEPIEGLDFVVTRLALPAGLDLAEAQALAASLTPGIAIEADNLHYRSGRAALGMPARAGRVAPAAMRAATASGARAGTVEVGMIDGGPGASVPVIGQKGFAYGAPRPSDHASAVASLLRGAGAGRIRSADVYGADPAGGNALALARALGWLTASGSRVVAISLVGPRNAVVERAVAAAQARGVVIVAAVGNDGRASPPAYPASYPGVVSITGTDRRGRALVEAGRAHDLDYAAPGADVFAHDARGRIKKWRGTSFATPLAAARIAAAMGAGGNWRSRVDREARDLGARGPDEIYGRGLLCEPCGRKN